jgi:signal transduction histidine kinase/HAMP domain-containing protein
MRLRTQFIITMLLFCIILIYMAASAIIAQRQGEQAGQQEKVASSIAQGASELSYLANDYLLYRENQQLKRWQSRFGAFSAEVAALRAMKPEQQALIANIQANQTRLKEVFDSAASALKNSSRNQGTALDPALLQVSWSRMAVQSQGLVSDAQRLSQLLRQQMDQITKTRSMLMYVMAGFFGLFLLASYLLTYRRILKSMSTLQAGAVIIGSGNLDFKIEEKKHDEIGDLSRAFNRMTTDLKSVTASKADLEREVTERKRVEARLAYLASFPERNTSPIMEVDLDGVVRYMNPAALNLFPDLSEKGLTHPWLVDWATAVRPFREGQTDTGVRDVEVGKHSYNQTFYYASQDRLLRIYGMDITERKRAEEALKKTHTELQEHADRLEAANKELESFTYSVSHDLRSPLRAIAGFTRMILNEKGATFDPETRRKFGIVQDNAHKMGRLVDDLLRLSRLGRIELNWSKVDMKGLVREVLQEIRTTEPEREFTAEIRDLPRAHGDPTMIRQLLANLLSNAVKFTRGKQDARIEVGSFEESGEQVCYVKDNGVGFDMKYYNKLFGVFQRLVSEREFEGTGVGLAIVQRIVQRHGGRVWAEGKIHEGATFYFTLPPKEQR